MEDNAGNEGVKHKVTSDEENTIQHTELVYKVVHLKFV